MPRTPKVVSSRNLETLLSGVGARRMGIETAMQRGLIVRLKVGGVWLYAADEGQLSDVMRSFPEALDLLVTDWFVAHAIIAGRSVAKATSEIDVDAGVADALMRKLLSQQRYGALPILNRSYSPYFAVYAHTRHDHVTSVMAEAKTILTQRGEIRAVDLMVPDPLPSSRAWQTLVLGHFEYLGLGRSEEGVFHRW